MTQMDTPTSADGLPAIEGSIQQYIAVLAASGIKLTKPCGEITLSPFLAQIGELAGHDGILEVTACSGITMFQQLQLLQFAETAWAQVIHNAEHREGLYPPGWVYYSRERAHRQIVVVPHMLGLSASPS